MLRRHLDLRFERVHDQTLVWPHPRRIAGIGATIGVLFLDNEPVRAILFGAKTESLGGRRLLESDLPRRPAIVRDEQGQPAQAVSPLRRLDADGDLEVARREEV